MLSFLKPKLAICHCTTGKDAALGDFPAWVGGKEAHFSVDDSDHALCEFGQENGTIQLKAFNGGLVLNGEDKSESLILLDQDYAMVIEGHLILFSFTKNYRQWLASRNRDSWRILDSNSQILAGPAPLRQLATAAGAALANSGKVILSQANSTTGFYLSQVASVLGFSSTPPPQPPPVVSNVPLAAKASQARAQHGPEINTDSGDFTCPACWLRFDRGDVMHLATHSSLRGDSILGEEAMIRFLATQFNDRGQALDAMGIPSTEMACPHCRRKLPPSFLDLPQHIISVVGAPSSGKSYFLCVVVKVLETILFPKFGVAFFDGDPSENIQLTEMKNKLFSAASPLEARLAKTALEGDMYIEVPRMGRQVRMPKPFVFNLQHKTRPDQAVTTVFYDNAGEHFEPTRNSNESPGAQHVAAASGIIFLFDPTYNLEFRKRLADHHDPQIKDQRFDQQNTILAEMNARVKTLKALDFREKIDTPLALVVGKCDVWQGLLGEIKFTDPVGDAVLDLKAVKKNSMIVRDLLMEIAPAIVANAEALSNNVMYFPVSSFGCSPELVGVDANGRPSFSPDPNKISPILVEAPLLWLFSLIEPNLVQASSSN